jgi:hypothetical protein
MMLGLAPVVSDAENTSKKCDISEGRKVQLAGTA